MRPHRFAMMFLVVTLLIWAMLVGTLSSMTSASSELSGLRLVILPPSLSKTAAVGVLVRSGAKPVDRWLGPLWIVHADGPSAQRLRESRAFVLGGVTFAAGFGGCVAWFPAERGQGDWRDRQRLR